MKIKKSDIKELIGLLGFKPQEGEKDIYYKNYPSHKNYVLKVDFEQEKIDYGTKIKLGDLTTSNFENSENFVVLEGVNRVLEKGYAPGKLSLEHKWPMGRKEKGKLDILVMDKDDKAYLMIECKTWGDEYEKEKKKMQRDGGQLFSYFQQDKSAQYLCLYASRVIDGKIEPVNDIVKVDEAWKELGNQKEIFDHWNKNFKDNGIFEEWANAYDIEIKSLTRGRLKELTEEDSGRIYNQFAEILRHNVVSDKPNAFNKIFNLFLCKIVDEDRKPNEELKFQWLETDSNEDLQKRLSDLYKQGMKEYLTKEVTDYNDEQVEEKLYALDAAVRDQIREMFTRVRLHKNNEFAFKEVFDEKSFEENAVVVREVVELLQPYQIRYGHKQQFLGDFFELLLSTGIKQEAGQFFTPVPIAKFIISSLPLRELIKQKIENDETHFLPYIIDYAAGSGHFLTESMDEVQNIINEIHESKQRPSVKRNLSSWKISPFDWAYDYVYGIEADYRLVKTAKVSCFLNGDGLANVIHADGLDHFQKSIDYKGKLKEVSKEDPKDNGVFDVLIANPPYSVSAFKNTLKNGEESFDLFNRLTDDSSEIECLFIERTKQLLKPGGWAGIILPSSILSNSGIYTDAREIILKYFAIKAIAEFGSNTFMATGTNTVTLFLERRANNDWKKIESAIKNFFDKPKEATVSGIEKAFTKYVDEVFEDISLQDYISLVNKKPNESISKTELFTDYKAWFNGLTEIKNLKKKKGFKDKTKDEQQAELDKLFYDKVFTKEQDKMLYFFLAQPQQTVLIKVGEKQAEKDFIGYEFSSRRGHEGIKMYRDENGKPTTKLYDDDNHLNEEKANSYVYRAFLGEQKAIDESLQNNLNTFDLPELIDFKKLAFEKAISMGVKKKIKIKSKFDLKPLSEFTKGFTGIVFDKTDESQSETDLRILTASNIDLITKSVVFEKSKFLKNNVKLDKEEQLKKGDIFICTSSGSLNHLGKFAFIENDMPYWAGGFCAILRGDDFITQKYVSLILGNIREYRYFVESFSGQNINNLKLSDLWNFKIPNAPKSVKEKIIKDVIEIEKREKLAIEKLNQTKSKIENFFAIESKKHNELPLSKIISLQNGKGLSKAKMISGPFNVYGGNGINGTHNAFVSEKATIAIGRVGAYCGAVHLTEPKSWITDNSMFVNKLLKDLNLKYLYFALKNLNLNQFANQSSHPNISQPTVLGQKIPFPDKKEQDKIIIEIEKLETEIAQIETELATMDEQKEQILKKHLE